MDEQQKEPKKITVLKHITLGNLYTIGSVLVTAVVAYLSYSASERQKAIIAHDRDQKLDSICIIVGTMHAEQEENKANTVTRIRQRDKEKAEDDARTSELKTELAQLKQEMKDLKEEIFNHHKK